MAYTRTFRRYRKRTPYKRTYRKRYGKKYGRRRFKNKRFVSTKATNVSRNLISRNQYVKLPWSYVDRAVFTASTLDPIKYAFSGNGSSPSQFIDENLIASGNSIPRPAGYVQYSQFYNKARVHGSSIRIELLTNSGADQASPNLGQAVRVCLLALPYESTPPTGLGPVPTAGAGNWTDANTPSPKNLAFIPTTSTLATMWNASYEHLINHPYAKWFTIGGNGATSRCTMKMFRKTKIMSQVKDLKDNDEFEFTLIPRVNGSGTQDIIPSAKEGFVYFLYVFPTKPATTQDSIVLTVKMKYYYEFYDFIPQDNQAYTDTT